MREMVLHYIFLDLRKAYYALYKVCCLDILVRHGVGPRTLRILQTYWVQLQMAKKAGENYGPIFQSHRWVNQGDPCHSISLTCLLTLSSDTG